MTLLKEKSSRASRSGRRNGRMSEDEFVRWVMSNELARAEWVDGEVEMMAPISGEHSDLGLWLLSVLSVYTREKDLGLVRGSEFMVRLAFQKSRRVPDVLFVTKRRLNQFRPNHLEGAPDLIMEVVSPESVARDWREKYQEYEKAGVREYWIVDPNTKRVEAYFLDKSKRYRRIDPKDQIIYSKVIKGFCLRIDWLWSETRPSVLVALKQLGVTG
jgi:Uma2 family endonuclease